MRLTIGALLTLAAGGFLYLGRQSAGGIVVGVDTPVIVLSRGGGAVRYRDHLGEYRVRQAPILINGFGFQRGGGIVQGRDGATEVSRYTLLFEDDAFPASDLQLASKNNAQLSGVVRVPVELLTDAEIDKPRSFRIYDRIEAQFLPVASRNGAMIRFRKSAPSPAVTTAQAALLLPALH